MSRRITRLLIAAALLATAALSTISATEEYEPLTPAEAEAWLRSIDLPELVDFVIRYDYVEHSEPVIEAPTYNVVIVGDEITLSPRDPLELTVGHLSYSIDLPPQTAAYDPEGGLSFGNLLAAGAIGIVAGVPLGLWFSTLLR
jgi:hypothetical protein